MQPLDGGNSQENGSRRLVVVENEYASSHKRVLRNIDELRSAFPAGQVVVVKTEAETDATVDKLVGILVEGDDLVSGGGDGNLNTCVHIALHPDIIDLGIRILALAGGSSSDSAIMANGNLVKASPSEVLRYGQAVPVFPIETTIKHDYAEYMTIAAIYTGYGNTGSLARTFGGQAFRGMPLYGNKLARFAYEAAVVGVKFFNIDSFEIADKDGERMIGEKTIANGHRMAKIGKFPVSLALPELFMTELADPSMLKAAVWAGKLVGGKLSGVYIFPSQEYAFKITDKNKRPVMKHDDAEWEALPPNTDVTIKQGSRSFDLISLSLLNL